MKSARHSLFFALPGMVPVDEAVVEHVWTLASLMLKEFRECPAKPDVVAE
jgi:hypothetical protein